MSAAVVRPWKATHRCMGTVASLHVHDAVDTTTLETAAAAVFAELDRLEAIFSTFRPHSEISRVNRGELHLLDCSPEVVDVLDACTWLEHATGGAFSCHPPEQPGVIDPAGFVKGWATERATRCCSTPASTTGTWPSGAMCRPTAGLATAASGSSPSPTRSTPATSSPPWRSTTAPWPPRAPRSGVTTCGTAARGAGRRLASVTVIGPHLTWADAFATAGFAMGDDGIDWVSGFEGYHALAVTLEGVLVADPFSPPTPPPDTRTALWLTSSGVT